MSATLPLHRRARRWYGVRDAAPTPERGHEPPARSIPLLTRDGRPLQVRQAPVDRRETSLL